MITTYQELSKSGIVALVLISVLVGYLIGHPFEKSLDFVHLLITLFSILLLASGASALNQLQECKIDAAMPRTAKRPLPSKRITPEETEIFIIFTLCLGVLLLMRLSLVLCALGLLSVFIYNILYTLWWKKRYSYAAIPGAIPGALPILMGFVAASGRMDYAAGFYLFFILFYWQMPHFWVLALKYKEDYRHGGIPTLPVTHGTGITVNQIILWCLGYVGIVLVAPLFLRVGIVYMSVALVMSAYLLLKLRSFAKMPASNQWLKFFLVVNLSLIVYLAAAVADLWSVYVIAYFT